MKKLTLSDLKSKLKLSDSQEYYILPFSTIRNSRGVFKFTNKSIMSLEELDELVPAICSGSCSTLKEYYYAMAFRDESYPYTITDAKFLAKVIVKRSISQIPHKERSIFFSLDYAEQAWDYIFKSIKSSEMFQLGEVSEDDIASALQSILKINHRNNSCALHWHISSLKNIYSVIDNNQDRFRIIIGSPGTGKSYLSLKESGDVPTLVISLSNVVGANLVSRAMNHPDFKFKSYEFMSYTKLRYMLYRHGISYFERYSSVIFEEASMITTDELHLIEQIISLDAKIYILGDTYQLPGFLGLGNLLHSLIKSFPNIVTTLSKNYRATDYPELVEAFESVKKTGNPKVRGFMDNIIVDDSTVISRNKAIKAWVNDVKEGVDTFACTFKSKDVNLLNNIILKSVFKLKSELPDDPTFSDKSNVFSELLLKGKEFEVVSTVNLKDSIDYYAFNGERFSVIPKGGDKIYLKSHKFSEHNRYYSLQKLVACFDLAYAMTIHKLQGSEASSVLYYEPEISNFINSLNLRYVGLSRCKRKLYISISKQNRPLFYKYNNILQEALNA